MSSSDDLVGAHNGAAAHQGTANSTGEHDLYNSGGDDQEEDDLDYKKSCNNLLEKSRVENISWHDLRGSRREDQEDGDLGDKKNGNNLKPKPC